MIEVPLFDDGRRVIRHPGAVAGAVAGGTSDWETWKMNRTLFLYSGEGTHGKESRYGLLKHSPKWSEMADIIGATFDLSLERLWNREIGGHRCPYSPILTVVTQICLADIWRRWGYHPDIMIGHSTGELAAAYEAGFYGLDEVLSLAHRIGTVAAKMDGTLAHGVLSDDRIADAPFRISSFNFRVDSGSRGGRHVTVTLLPDEVAPFLRDYPNFVKMKLPHPWHHPDYRQYADPLAAVESGEVAEGRFVSGVTARFETRLRRDHWREWLVSPIDFIQSFQTIRERYDGDQIDIIEIGFHPVLSKCCEIFRRSTYVSSMYRGEDDIAWILRQRRELNPEIFKRELRRAVDAFKPNLDVDEPLSYQGFGSLEFTELSVKLQPFFPSLAPQDFYRFKTINQLIDKFGVKTAWGSVERSGGERHVRRNGVVISGMSCRLPAAVETPAQFWDMLLSREDQVSLVAGRGGAEAGFLDNSVSRFDHRYFGISAAEARTMDPQQILALELTEMLWRDAGIDPESLDRERVGVYIGVWNQEYRQSFLGDTTSVFYPTGVNPSIIASRISYHYDLRGPSWVSNTACSSSLVAVHYAVKDIEAGRVDYAVAGGVNMLLDEGFTANMRRSGFLSKENRCKSFDDSANGYVRAEGGGLVLLVNKALAERYYAEVAGTAINQNGRRSQVITAPHPEAQAELIAAACRDAGIRPTDIAYVECHGTGTKIGDPIEISAIKNSLRDSLGDSLGETIAGDGKRIRYLGSVKSNLGHLESAAGIAGLIKSAAILVRGTIPPNLHFNHPNEFIDFESANLRVVTEETPIEHESHIGVSSFGFGGSNAHVILKGCDAAVRKEIGHLEIPFDREGASPISAYLTLLREMPPAFPGEPVDPEQPAVETLSGTIAPEGGDIGEKRETITRESIDIMIGRIIFEVANLENIDPEVELMEQGLDSMSGTELISQLETLLGIEIDPDILLENPYREGFVDQLYELAAGIRSEGSVKSV